MPWAIAVRWSIFTRNSPLKLYHRVHRVERVHRAIYTSVPSVHAVLSVSKNAQFFNGFTYVTNSRRTRWQETWCDHPDYMPGNCVTGKPSASFKACQ